MCCFLALIRPYIAVDAAKMVKSPDKGGIRSFWLLTCTISRFGASVLTLSVMSTVRQNNLLCGSWAARRWGIHLPGIDTIKFQVKLFYPASAAASVRNSFLYQGRSPAVVTGGMGIHIPGMRQMYYSANLLHGVCTSCNRLSSHAA